MFDYSFMDFKSWLLNRKATSTANSYRYEMERLPEFVNRIDGLRKVEKWMAGEYKPVMTMLKKSHEWRDYNSKKHNSSSAAIRQYFEYLDFDSVDSLLVSNSGLMSSVFLNDYEVESIKRSIETKKNIILQGPPGTGKTYIAKRLAYALMEEEAKDRVEVVQFHQSYSYEDFIQGFRPKEGGGFERRDGVFFRFCDKARRDPGRDYFFLIDEINRGNLSKIFGELMMLIEADKRGESNHVQLTYSKEGEHFSIPENVHIIGTMNTADRSLAMVDYALRRRFAFFYMPPQFNDKFEAYLQEEHSISASMVKRIVAKVTALNGTIKGDDNLGDGFEIGHSYFCTDVPKGSDEETWYAHIVDHEIGPQLMEYWFDDKPKAQAQIDLLKA